MNKQQLLDEIKADILNNNVCSGLAKSASQLVFGVGNPDADIVFIGEAPGKKEDELGQPFVGTSGQFLNDMLQSIHLNRNQIYITNIVKYRPPNNRDPLPEEKNEFLPYLERQLNVINPLLIVTLGRHSTNVFLPGLSISQIHGQPKRTKWRGSTTRELDAPGDKRIDAMQGAGEQRTEAYKKYTEGVAELATQQGAMIDGRVSSSARKQAGKTLVILPLYHPAAALYNGALRKTLEEDFKNINKTLQLIREGK
jgi:DNA polymerase